MKKRLLFILTFAGAIGLSLDLFSTGWSPRTPGVSTGDEAARSRAPGDDAASVRRASGRVTPLLPTHQLLEEAIVQEQDQTPSTMAEITESILEDDPELAEFHRIRGKALRTKEEKRSYQQMLADPVRIEAAKQELLRAVTIDEELTQEDEVRRIMQLKYLTSSVDWSDNPRRDETLDAIRKVVLAQPRSDLSSAQRGSVLGDKIDLYQHLLIGDPMQARLVKAEAAGTRLEGLLEHAEKMLSSPVEAAQEARVNSGG